MISNIKMNVKKHKNYQLMAEVDASFITRNWRLLLLQIQNKLFLAWVAYNYFNLPYNTDTLQTIKQILFPDISNSESVGFTFDDVTNYDLVYYNACCFLLITIYTE